MSVYFAQRRRNGLIKIGWSRTVRYRLQAMKAKLLGNIPGERAEEKKMHKKFAHLRVRGEWHKPADELLEYIRTRAQDAVPDAKVVQTAIKLPNSLLVRINKLAAQMSAPGMPVTRSDLLRGAAYAGIAQLELEMKKR